MKKGFTMLLLAVLLTVSGCSSSQTVTDESSNLSEESVVSTSSAEESKIVLSSSTVNAPLGLNTWGNAAKYCTQNQQYVTVPVSVTNITRGTAAEKTVKAYAEKSEVFTYTAPEKGQEWVVADYQISLENFPMDEGGTTADITAFVSDKGGHALTWNKQSWITSPVSLSDGKYAQGGTIKGKFAFLMLRDKQDYVLTLGEYDETQMFFSEKTQ